MKKKTKTKKTKTKNTKQVTITVPIHIFQTIKDLAIAEGRNNSNMCSRLVERGIKVSGPTISDK